MSRKITAIVLAMLLLPLSAMNTLADEGDPDLSIDEISFSDDSPAGGDTITITAVIANDGGASGLVSVTTNVSFYWDGNFIAKDTVTVPGSNTADAEAEWRAVGGTHTITVIVDEEEQIREEDEENNEESETINVAYPPILLLDDDGSSNNGGYSTETDGYYANALNNLSSDLAYDIIRVNDSADAPDYDTLSQYSLIIWVCGADYQSGETDVTFTASDKENVAEYLEGGGALWAIGQDILYDFNTADGERSAGDFEYDYFGISYVDHDRSSPENLTGVDGDPISDGIEYQMDPIMTDFADDLNPRSGFEKVFNSGVMDDNPPDGYNISTVRTEDEFNLVFMTVDLSSISDSDERDELMNLVVEYLIEQLENDVSVSRFNTPVNEETVEPGVENNVNVTVRNRGTEDQSNVEVNLEIRCNNNSYTFTDTETVSIDSGEGVFVNFDWDTPDDEDYEYDIKVEAIISNDEKTDNNEKQISVNTYVTYDLGLSDSKVTPMIAEKNTDREMSVLVTNLGDVTLNSDVSGKVYDGAEDVIYNGGTKSTGDLAPGDSVTLNWDWEAEEYGTFWFQTEILEDDDEIPENDKESAMMRSVDIEFSDDMEDGRNGWKDYKSLGNPWHLVDSSEDSNRESASPTHSMWVGDESKGDGEYDNNWDFSLYSADNISLGSNPQMSVNIWYSTEFSWDGGNVQISNDGGENWEVIVPDGGYPDDAVVGLDNEPGYTGVSGDGDEADWETANFNLANYSGDDVRFKFRFGTDSSVNTYEGWYIDDVQVNDGITTEFEDDFEDGDGNWASDFVPSEWNYYKIDEEYGKAYSGDYSWYLGNPDNGVYSPSLNDSLESPMIDLGDGSEKYVSAMIWFGIDGPYDDVSLEINQSNEWTVLANFPGDNGDFSEDYNDADDNGWLYVEYDVTEYEGDVSFRLRFVSNTYTQYDGLYVDDFSIYSLPPIPNDVGTKKLEAPDTAKPGRTVTFDSEIYNFGTEDQENFEVRATVTRDDGTEVYNSTQLIDDLDSKDNTTLQWTWEGGPEGTYTIRVQTLLDDDERAGNNPKEKVIDIAESGYNIALAVQDQAKDVLSGESVFFNFTATNTGENSGYYDITVESYEEDDWRCMSLVSSIYLAAGSSQNFTVVAIAPTYAPTGDEHEFNVTVTSRDDPETSDNQEITAIPIYNQQNGGDKVLLVDANFGKNNGYNNYYDVDKIDQRLKASLQDYFNDGESRGYDVYTIPYDSEAGSFGELHPYPSLDLMTGYDVVIWTQGDHNQRNITNWSNCIGDYLDAGGNLWIMGQQFLTALNYSNGPREAGDFEYDYLMAEYVSNNEGTSNPLIGVDDDEIFGDAEYDTGNQDIFFYDYADWIRPRDDAIGAFYTDNSNWWNIVDTVEDPNRKANSPTHSMWIGDASKNDGEYQNGWDQSIYTVDSYTIQTGGQLRFQHYYDTESASYPYDGGNVQISTDEGETWEVINPSGGYPANSVTGLDGEPGYYGQSSNNSAFIQATFDLSNFSGEDVRFKFRFGADGVIDSYEGWYFDDVELRDVTGVVFSDDMESGMDNWNSAIQVFNLSLHYEGDYRLIMSPFTFGKVNTSDDRNDMVGRALDWLRAAAAADDVGVRLIELESEVKENSTISFSSIIKNYGSNDQAPFNVEARVLDSNNNEMWADNQLTEPLESGEQQTLEWEWESEHPGDFTIIVETQKEDENERNNQKDLGIYVEMIHDPEITTFDNNKQGRPDDSVTFDLTVHNHASGTDTFYFEMSGVPAEENWGTLASQLEIESNESKDIELKLTIPDDTDYDDYPLSVHVTAGDVTETIELNVEVTANPTNYGVSITGLKWQGKNDGQSTEAIAGDSVEFSITIKNEGEEEDTFDIVADGNTKDWVTFDNEAVTIGAEGETTVNGIFEIPRDAEEGNEFLEITVTSRADSSAEDEDAIRLSIEEFEGGVALTRVGSGFVDIAPGEFGEIEYKLGASSDANSEQTVSIVVAGTASEWAEASIQEATFDVEDLITFTVTVSVPAGATEEIYRLEVKIISQENEEEARSVTNINVAEPFVENVDLSICVSEITADGLVCLQAGGMDSTTLEVPIEAGKLEQVASTFLIKNDGNMDVKFALELTMPNGDKDTDLYLDQNGKEWRLAMSPSPTDSKEFPTKVKAGDYYELPISLIAREVNPGSYTFTLKLLLANEAGNSWAFETLNQITMTINVEGEVTEETGEAAEEDSLLPGPSFVSVIALLTLIVYRRKLNL